MRCPPAFCADRSVSAPAPGAASALSCDASASCASVSAPDSALGCSTYPGEDAFPASASVELCPPACCADRSVCSAAAPGATLALSFDASASCAGLSALDHSAAHGSGASFASAHGGTSSSSTFFFHSKWCGLRRMLL